MKLTWKHSLVPGATALAAATLFTTGIAQQGGNSATAVGKAPMTATLPKDQIEVGAGASRLAVVSPQGAGSSAIVVNTSGSSVDLGAIGIDRGSGMSRNPSTGFFYVSGGNTDGGNLYIGRPGGSLLIGPSGFPNVSGLAFNPADGRLYGTATVAVLSDGLIELDPATGAGTLVGGGMGIGGIDSIAFNPADGNLYGSTGFFYDGSPGDKLIIDPSTGLASDSGQDMSPTPTCTVAGMAFASDGTGYVSIGCGNATGTGGDIYSWDVNTNALTFVTNATGGSSANDLEVIN